MYFICFSREISYPVCLYISLQGTYNCNAIFSILSFTLSHFLKKYHLNLKWQLIWNISLSELNIIEKDVIMIITSLCFFMLENISIDIDTKLEILKQRNKSNSPLTVFISRKVFNSSMLKYKQETCKLFL